MEKEKWECKTARSKWCKLDRFRPRCAHSKDPSPPKGGEPLRLAWPGTLLPSSPRPPA